MSAKTSARSSRSRATSDSGKKRKIAPGTKVWKEGMLMKMGAVHKAWQPRYMVLRGGVWEYYNDINAWKDGKDPKGQLLVAEAKAARSKELEAEKKLGLTFTPAGSDRTYLFMCASFDDQQKWLTALNDAIAAEPSFNPASSKLALAGRPRQGSLRSPEISNSDIDIEGWLMRKGSGIGGVGLKTWTKRYFRLTSLSFSMFKNEKDSKPLSTTSVGNLDNCDYFATKREGNRFDVLSHDEFGSSLTSLYATDAKAAIRWCRRIRKAMDEWEQTKDKLHQKQSELHHRPNQATQQDLAERRLSANRHSDTESGKEDGEEDDQGADNTDEAQGRALEVEEDEPAENPPDVEDGGADEEQQILRDRQRAETGVETKQVMENNTHLRRGSAQDIEQRFLNKKAELERALQAFEDNASGEEDSDSEVQSSFAAAEFRTFPHIGLPSLVDILTRLEMTDYRNVFQQNNMSSLDFLEVSSGRLTALVPARGPRGRLSRYLQPFLQTKANVEALRNLKQVERSLDRIGSELSRAGSSLTYLSNVFRTDLS